jgi:hypothetical protein
MLVQLRSQALAAGSVFCLLLASVHGFALRAANSVLYAVVVHFGVKALCMLLDSSHVV